MRAETAKIWEDEADVERDSKKGGGIGGLVLALAAKNRGYVVKLFERDLSAPWAYSTQALTVLQAIDKNVAKQIMEAGCVTGDRIYGLADGTSGEWSLRSLRMEGGTKVIFWLELKEYGLGPYKTIWAARSKIFRLYMLQLDNRFFTTLYLILLVLVVIVSLSCMQDCYISAVERDSDENVSALRMYINNYRIMLMETFTRKKSTDEIVFGEMSLKRWVSESLHNSITEVVDSYLLSRKDENFAVKEQCVLSILSLVIECTRDSPEQRINMREVVNGLLKIRDVVY
ncbi:hypothetical protein QYF36_011428 [Acer negundo]|nr:hypothetical protein QYF36_011428 [Acer negundo]